MRGVWSGSTYRHVAPHAQSRQQQSIRQQLLRPVGRRLVRETFHDPLGHGGQAVLQRQVFGQSADQVQAGRGAPSEFSYTPSIFSVCSE